MSAHRLNNGHVIFQENAWESNNPKLEHLCEDFCLLTRYPKDRTFAQMRRDVYFAADWWSSTQKERHADYIATRNDLKPINKELRELFIGKSQRLDNVLTQFRVIRFLQIPKCFKIQITEARFLRRDGNTQKLLCADNDFYYCIDWTGS